MLVQTGKKDPGNPPHKKTSKNTKTVLILLVLYFNIFFKIVFFGVYPLDPDPNGEMLGPGSGP